MQSEIHECYNLSSVSRLHVRTYLLSLYSNQKRDQLSTRRNIAHTCLRVAHCHMSRIVIVKSTFEQHHFLLPRKHDIAVPILIEIDSDKSTKLESPYIQFSPDICKPYFSEQKLKYFFFSFRSASKLIVSKYSKLLMSYKLCLKKKIKELIFKTP